MRSTSFSRTPLAAPARVADAYGLFATMTEGRWEIEFQGSRDGWTWVAYPFRYKPQDVDERPGVCAPYQPRFEWNLWFASLEPWQASEWVVLAQRRLVEGSPAVLRLSTSTGSRPWPSGGRRAEGRGGAGRRARATDRGRRGAPRAQHRR